MPGLVVLVAACFRCGRVFNSNPNLVPSFRIDGKQHVLCALCVAAIQDLQRGAGTTVWPDPLPGAYEACDESEL